MRIFADTDIPTRKSKAEISDLLVAQWPYEEGRFIKGRGWVNGFQEAVEMWVKGFNNWKVYHTKDSKGSRSGFPDLCGVHEITGITFYAELKIEKGNVSQDQKEWLHALSIRNEHVFLWFPSDEWQIMQFLMWVQDRSVEMVDKRR
jgi:hypothetical protein